MFFIYFVSHKLHYTLHLRILNIQRAAGFEGIWSISSTFWSIMYGILNNCSPSLLECIDCKGWFEWIIQICYCRVFWYFRIGLYEINLVLIGEFKCKECKGYLLFVQKELTIRNFKCLALFSILLCQKIKYKKKLLNSNKAKSKNQHLT